MLVAIFAVHLSGGFLAPEGFEYPFTLAGMALALMVLRWRTLVGGPARHRRADSSEHQPNVGSYRLPLV